MENTTPHTVTADGVLYTRIEAASEAAAGYTFGEQSNLVEEFTIETVRGLQITVTIAPETVTAEDDTPEGESGVFAVDADVTIHTTLVAYDAEDATEQFEGGMGNDPYLELTVGDRLDAEIRVDFDSIDVSEETNDE